MKLFFAGNMIPFVGARKRVFYGWWIVVISVLVNAVPAGLYFIGFSVLFLPISRDLGISRAATSLPFSLTRVISGVQSPFIGMAIDRLGPGKVLFASVLIAGLGFVLLSFVDSYLMFFLVILLVLSPPMISGFDSTSITATCQWFAKKRGMALAIIAMGFALGGSVLTPLLAIASDAFGWRNTALGVGLLLWLIYLPLSTRLHRSPEDRGLLPDGEPPRPVVQDSSGPKPKTAVGPSSLSEEISPRRAFRTSTYWILAFSLAMRGMVFTAIAMHMVAIMVWKGIDEATAGLLIGLFALPWIPVSLFMGWMGDHWRRQRIAAMGGIVSGLGMFLLAFMDRVEIWQMIAVFVLWAFSEGSLPLGWAMLADQFGRRNLGVLRGGIMGLFSFLSIGTPLYAGWVFDKFESYQWLIIPAGFILVAAGVLNWIMPQLKARTKSSSASASADPLAPAT